MALELRVYAGSDQASVNARFQADVARSGVSERIRCAENPGALADAVSAPSLFGGRRVIAVELDGVDEKELEQIEASAPTSDALVVARATELSPKRKSRLETLGKVVVITTPQRRDTPRRVQEFAETAGVRLDAAATAFLAKTAGHDLHRVRSVIEQCRIGAITDPSVAQLAMLCGTSSADSLPWEVGDHLEKGELIAAIDSAAKAEPLAVIGYLTNRYIDATRIAEEAVRRSCPVTAELAEEVTGLPRWQAERLASVARRHSPSRLAEMLTSLARAESEAKLGDGYDSVILLLSRLAKP